MIKSLSIIGLLLGSIFTSLTAYAVENDFNSVCEYFNQLESLPNSNTMSPLQRNDFILNKMAENLPVSSNAQAAWKAIGYAVAEQRYDLFKESAESLLNKPWSCPAMKKLAAITGEF